MLMCYCMLWYRESRRKSKNFTDENGIRAGECRVARTRGAVRKAVEVRPARVHARAGAVSRKSAGILESAPAAFRPGARKGSTAWRGTRPAAHGAAPAKNPGRR